MADVTNLEALIDQKIVPNNHAQLITGQKLNDTLHEMVGTLNEVKQDTIDEGHKLPYALLDDTPNIPSRLADLEGDSTHRTVTDTEKSTWNGKQNAISDLATIRSNAEAGKTASDNLGGHTVAKDVPADAVFTEYDDTEIKGRVSDLEGEVNKIVLNGMTASQDGSTVKLSLAKINIKTGSTSSVDVPLPVVDANTAGVLNPQTYNTIVQNQTLINAIIGASVAVSGLPEEPTQQQVTNAWLTASGQSVLVNGARLFDVTNTKVWTYYTNTELWYPVEAEGGGTVTIAQWTNSALGTVKGVADNSSHTNDGKLTAESDGTGSVLGWDRLVSRVQTIEGYGSTWNGKYTKPSNGIPKSDLASAVQTSLGKADSAYQKPSNGIPSTDFASEVQTTLGKVTDLESNLGNKENKNIIDSDTSTTAVSEALVVGKTYKYMPSAGVATLAFTLTPPTETDVVKFWRFKFLSGATATEFTPPSGLYWANGESLVPEANTIYEVMIDEDYCVSVLAFKQVSA